MLTATACLPSRDNTHDPKNRPQAKLFVVDAFDPELGACSTDFGLGRSYASIGTARRSSCVALDARGSEDPQRDPLADLDFEFGTLVDGEFTELPQNARAATLGSGGSVVLLARDWLAEQPLRTPIEFAVIVRDSTGASGEDSADLTLENSRPVAIAGAPIRLTLGGDPWAPGAPYQVTFAGRGVDPDGDDIQRLCWTFPGEPGPVCHAPEEPPPARSISSTVAQRVVAELRVDDGDELLPSHPAAAVVTVGPANVFFASVPAPLQPGGAVTRPDVDARDIVIDGNRIQSAVPLAPAGGVSRFAGWNSIPRLYVLPLPALGPPLAALDLGEEPRAIAATPDGGTLLLARHRVGEKGGIPSAGVIDRVTVGATSLSIEPEAVVILDPVFDTYNFTDSLVLESDAAGNVWAAVRRFDDDTLSPVFFVAEGADTAATGPAVPGYTVHDLAARPVLDPADAQVWSTYLPVASSGSSSRIVVAEPDAPSGVRSYDVGSSAAPIYAPHLEWWNEDLFWLATHGAGLFLVEAALLDELGFEGAVLLHLPHVDFLDELFVDRATGMVWGYGPDIGQTRLLWQVSPDGTSLAHPAGDPPAKLHFIDDGGGIVHNSLFGIELSRTTAITDENLTAAFFTPMKPGDGSRWYAFPDPVFGGLWVPVEILERTALARYAEDGTLLELLDEFVDEVGAPTVMPSVQLARMSPDGSSIWAWGPQSNPDSLVRVDLTTRPPVVRGVSAGTTETNHFRIDFQSQAGPFEPSAPLPASTPFVWVKDLTDVKTFTASGVSGPTVLTLSPGQSTFTGGSLIPATNELCLIARDTLGGSPPYEMRRLSPGGTVTSLGSFASIEPAGLFDVRVLAVGVSLPEGNQCWFSVAENGANGTAIQIKGFDETGTVIGAMGTEPGVPYYFSGQLRSMAVTSADRVWFSTTATDFVLLEIDAAVGTAGALTFLSPTFYGSIVAPGAAQAF